MIEPRITVRQYLSALKQNQLLGLKCVECGFVTCPPRLACRRCGAWDSEPVRLCGSGKIVSFTVVHIPPSSHHGRTPYPVILVELDEGPWIMGNLGGNRLETTSTEIIGQRVTMDNSLISQAEDKLIAPLFVLHSPLG